MSMFDTETPREKAPERNWALEVAIVAGIVAFGYFAVVLPSQPPVFADHSLDEVAELPPAQ